MTGPTPGREADDYGRRVAMGLLARASHDDLASGLAGLTDMPPFDDLRPPEIGLVMLRGRGAATGAPFNLGEATVARASVRLATGEVGFGYSLGRDLAKARLAALADALWADPDRRSDLEAKLLGPLRGKLASKDRESAERTAATRVDFFTMARGEDQTS